MFRLKKISKKLFTPVTILLIPHNSKSPVSLKLPSVGLVGAGVFSVIGIVFVLSMAVNAIEYRMMREKLDYYAGQFTELSATMQALKRSEEEFRKLFGLKNRKEVLENYHVSDSGSLDMEALRTEIEKSVESVSEIREYLAKQKDIYEATPAGWPVTGELSSRFGGRVHPITGRNDFHSGIDISTRKGAEVRATGNGIVSFAGYSGGNGNLVVIEHGQGFSTIYAHNEKISVRAGQVVRRGDVIAAVGSTGLSTGPHLHYEVWRDRRPQDPAKFIDGL